MLDQSVQLGTSLAPELLIISELQLNTSVYGWLFAVDVQTRPARNGKPDLFVVGTRRSIELLEGHFHELMSKVCHPGLRILLRHCFTSEVIERFRRWPAAVRHHGAVVGGLLEHTVNVTLIAERLSLLYGIPKTLTHKDDDAILEV